MTEQKSKKGNGIAKKLKKNILSPCIKSQSQKGKHPNLEKHDIDTIDNGTLSFDSTRYLKKKNSDLDTISSTVSLHSNRTESKLNNEITDSDPNDYLRRKQPKNKGKEKAEVTEIADVDSSDSEDDVPLSKLTKKQTQTTQQKVGTPLKNGENIEEIEESDSDVIKIPEFPMPAPSNTDEFFVSIPAKMEPTRSEMGSLVDSNVVKHSIPMPQPTDSKYDEFSTPVNDNDYIIEEIVTEEVVNGKKIITTQTITRRANKSNYSTPLDNMRVNEQSSIKMPIAVGSTKEDIKIPAKMTPTKTETTTTTEGIVEMPMNIPKPSTSKLFTKNGVPNLVETGLNSTPLSEIVDGNDPNTMAMPSIPQIPPEEPEENITDNLVSSPKLIEEVAYDPQQPNQPMVEPGFNINVLPPNQPVEAGFNFANVPPQDPAIDAGYYQQPAEPGFSFTVTNEDNMAIPLPTPGGHGNENILNNVQGIPNLLATDSANRKQAKQQGFLNIPQPLPPSAIEDNQVIEDDKSDVSYGSKKIVVSSPKSFTADEQIQFTEELTKKQEMEHEEALKNEKPIGTITMPKTPSTFFKNNNIYYNENDSSEVNERQIVEEESKNIISNIPDVESISDSDSETDSSSDDSSSDSETDSSSDSDSSESNDSSDDEKLFNIKQKYDQKKKEHESVNEEKKGIKEDIKEEIKATKEEIKESKEDVKEEVKEVKDDVKEEIKEVKDEVKDDVKEEVKEVKDEVKEELKEVKDEVKEEVKEVKDEVKEELKEVKDDVKDELKESKEDAIEKVENVPVVEEAKEDVKKEVVGHIDLANIDAVSEASFQDNLMGSLRRKNGARSIRSFFGFNKKDKKDKNDKSDNRNKQQIKKEEKKEEKQQQKKEEKQQKKEEKQQKKEEKQLKKEEKQQQKKEEKQLKKEEKQQQKKEEKRSKKEERQKLKREEAMSELPELPELPESNLAASDTVKSRRSSIRSFNEAHFSLKRLVSPFNRRSSSMRGRPTKEAEKVELSEANTTPEKPLNTETIQDSDAQVEKPVNDNKVNEHDKKESAEPVKLENENVDKKDDDQSSVSSSDSDDSKSISSSSSDEEVLGNIIQKKNINQATKPEPSNKTSNKSSNKPNVEPSNKPSNKPNVEPSNKPNVDLNRNYTSVENDDFVSLMMVQRMLSSSVDRSSSPVEIPELPKPVVNPYNVDVEYERRKSYSKPKAVVTAVTPRNETETQRSTVLYKFEEKPERPISSFYKSDFASRSLGSLPVVPAAAETNEYSPKQRMIELNLDTSKDSIAGPTGEYDINNKSTILDSDLKQMFEDIHNLSLDDIASRYTKDSMIQCDIGPSFMDEVMGSLSMK